MAYTLKDLVTTAEAARILKVNRRYVNFWFKKGYLKGERVSSRMVLIERSQLKKFIWPSRRLGIGRPPRE